MVYKEKIKMDKKEYDFYNKLLSLDLEEMCEDELEKEDIDFISSVASLIALSLEITEKNKEKGFGGYLDGSYSRCRFTP